MARSTVVRHEGAVGAFVLLAGALLAGGLVVKGTRVGLGAREVVFKADAGHDLKRGAPVKVRGIEVGEVSRVELKRDNSVEIRVKIFPDYRENIHADAVATIVEPPLFGNASVELTPGTGGELTEGAELKREPKEALLTKIQAGAEDLKKVVEKVEKVASKAETALDEASTIAKKINEGKGVLGRLVNDDKLADDFVKGVKELANVADDVSHGRGAWALLKDETLAPNVRGMVADVQSMTRTVAQGEGALGRLLSKDVIVVEAEGMLKDFRGTLARLDDIAKGAKDTTAKVDALLASGTRTFDRLEGTIKNAEKISGELVGVSEKINKGQGTLARFVNDDAVFKETRALLRELRESVEDLREQAPINAFLGVVFSAF